MTDRMTENRLRQLERDNMRLRDMIALRPIVVPAAAASALYILNNVVGGSTIWSSGAQSQTGIKYDAGTSVTTVPDVDASVPVIGTLDIGLGRASLLGGGTVYVCLRPDPGTGVVTGIVSDIPDGSQCESLGTVSLPLVSDATVLVSVYIVFKQ